MALGKAKADRAMAVAMGMRETLASGLGYAMALARLFHSLDYTPNGR